MKRLTYLLLITYLSISNVYSQNWPAGATNVPTSREAEVGIGQPITAGPPLIPFTELKVWTAPPPWDPATIPLSLYLNNKDQETHRNFGILKSGTFGTYLSGTWLDMGITPTNQPIGLAPQNPKWIIPDDWGFRANRGSMMATYGIRELIDCDGTLLETNPVLSWSSPLGIEGDDAKKQHFYIDHYNRTEPIPDKKRNIMKLSRTGKVGINLQTYALIENLCDGSSYYFGTFNRDQFWATRELFPLNNLDIAGNTSIGSGYAGYYAAPTDGLLVEGKTGFGTVSPYAFMHILYNDEGVPTLDVENTSTDDHGYNVRSIVADISTKGFAVQIASRDTDMFAVNGLGQTGIGKGFDPTKMLTVWGGDAVGNSWLIRSDVRFKQDIIPLTNALGLIRKIRGVRYNYNPNSIMKGNKNGKPSELKMKFSMAPQIGFIAQELEAIVPEFVDTDENGYKAVNYCQMVALLNEGIKEQQSQIEELQQEIENLKSYNISYQSKNTSGSNIDDKSSWLKQNQPNPFSQNSTIEMYINIHAKSASLRIYDLTGVQLKSYPIESIGFFNLPISTNGFKPGQYLYTLIIDGIEIDTKKMIIFD